MSNIFLHIINMSISAGWIVLAVLLLRIILKKAPKWAAVVLWGIVAVRLVCPFSFKSIFSLIPSAETVSPNIMMRTIPAIHTGISGVNSILNPIIMEAFAPAAGASVNPLQIVIPILAAVWLTGVLVFFVYTVIGYFRVLRRIGTAVLLKENIYQSENVDSPFVFGIIKPRIYLPYRITEQDMANVIAHEEAHIRRKDHLWKPLGFLLLAVYWFHPLIWIGYVLFCRDIEAACDEKVIREFDRDARADYSQALLSCSMGRRMVAACPLAFGEVGVKSRIKNVLHYKKPAFWSIAAAAVVCGVLAICFLTNPMKTKYEGPMAFRGGIKEREDGSTMESIIDFTEEGMDDILSVLNHGDWINAVPNCAWDNEIRTKNAIVHYHAECGTFYDVTHGRSCTLSEAERIRFNRMILADIDVEQFYTDLAADSILQEGQR